jgi:L-asparaginase II
VVAGGAPAGTGRTDEWPFRPWARFDRGGRPESWAEGVLVVVDDRGEVRARWGDPGVATYLRSSAKMIQAVPLVASGAPEALGLEPPHLALACASHDGESFHVDGVRTMLERAGLDESFLHCGPHPPLHAASARKLWRAGGEPLPVHNNCSGKHAGMLAASVHRRDGVRSYWRPEHPVQREIRAVLGALAGVEPEAIPCGVDGCGVPTFHLSVERFALAVARFAAGTGPAAPWAEACATLFDAMNRHPEMVGGSDRFCTAVPRAANRPVIAKGGAEGFYVVAWREGERGVCLAAKAAAGDSRTRDFAVAEALVQLGLVDDAGRALLRPWHDAPLLNHAGEEIGRRVALFDLLSGNGAGG